MLVGHVVMGACLTRFRRDNFPFSQSRVLAGVAANHWIS